MKEHWKKFVNRMIRIVRRLGLQKRFLLLVVFAVIFPLLFLETATFFSVRRVFQLSNYENMQQELDSYNVLVNNRLREYSSVGNKIATSLYTIKMLEKTSSDKQLDDFIQTNEYYKFLDEWAGELEDYIAVEVINKKGFIAYKPYQFTDSRLEESVLFSHIMSLEERQVWLGAFKWENTDKYSSPPSRKNLQYPLIISTKVKGAYSSDYLGCVNLYIDQFLLSDLLSEVLNYREKTSSLFSEEELFFIDRSGKIVSHKDPGQIGTYIEKELKENLKQNKIDQPESKVVFLNGGREKKLVFYSESKLTGMRMVALVDYKEFYQVINQIFKMMVFFSVLVLVVAGIVSWLYFISIKKPINQIVAGMKQVEKNNFSVVVEDEGKDELNYLTQRFNKMVNRTGELIDQKISMETEKKDAELRVLEEQINPHFLYNTLDMINWIAFERNDEKTCHIIESLSEFYRTGLNSGERIYTVRQEITHVSAYIEIQKERYQGKIKYHFDIQEETYPYEMVKVALQPLVENAIVHGIIPKGSKGNIWIAVKMENHEILFRVADDGQGLSEKQTMEKKSGRSSYGLRNVDARIKMYFGEDYGVRLEPGENGNGAVSVIRIPARMGGDGNEDLIGG